MSARTLWEEGRQPGHEVVALAAALTMTAVTVDLLLDDSLSFFFDLSFVAVCVGMALAVRPRDFFTIGVLPPLLMLAVCVLLAIADTDVLARSSDGVVQATVTGLAHHMVALGTGYALCLAVLVVRQRATRRVAPASEPVAAAPQPDRRVG
ncbi:hypothetical protein ENKNEFLB_03706 [Nocardioides aquaticus]|jgi:hypothetical protein|uniref:DUF6542 domain-containing protein n=1 Tax=Nocardioides aquaticus TaxID=160826 RepID=A0ABX8EL86_9ACTN|nr:DUF6542 domain-containing protein [Nocardioides aquaticus]QVT81298.1 hypothetical protein ENKNEFLB_03706 [Nocardioides aquaticus]